MPRFTRWRNVFRPEPLDRQLDDELQYHLAETVDRLIESGLSEAEAQREARRRLGSYCLQKERTREMNLAAWLDATRADLTYGLRQLRRNPGFATVAILSLALGLGANTAMFQLVNALQLRMLPVEKPQELVSIDFESGAVRSGWGSSRSGRFTYAIWEQIRSQQQAFAGVMAWSAARLNLTTGGEPRYAEALYVNGGFFETLGVNAVLRRTFTADDDRPGCVPVTVISHAFWQREFGGDPDVLSRVLTIQSQRVPIIGVTPASFSGVEVGNRYDLAVPLCADRVLADGGQSLLPGRASWWLSMIGRLKPGTTVQSASAQLRTLSPAIMQATLPSEYKPDVAKRFLNNKLTATEGGTGESSLRRDYERPLWLLMATAGLVLLIACANLANLLLARSTVREQEIAVRLAIGASRWRLIRQLLAESVLLAVAGTALGIALAMTLSRALVAFINSSDNPVFIDTALDWRVLGFTAALGILTCLMFGLLPAVRATYLAPVTAMRSGGRSVTTGRERFGLRRVLVSAQVALSLVLLVGALLFARSLHNLMTSDAGFQPESVMSVGIDFSRAPFPAERRSALYREFSERLSALPGVLSVAQVGATPVSGSSWDSLVGPDQAPAAGTRNVGFFDRAAPGYFRTMGTWLLMGREFDDRDTLTSPKVAIVNEMFARRFFSGANPVGRTFHLEAGAGQPETLLQVVGMVANTKYRDLKEEFRPIAFFPIAQDEAPPPGALFVLRLNGSPGKVINGAKAAITAISPEIGTDFRDFSTQLSDSLLREQLMAALSVGFGLLAGLLATLGLYGVIAYMIARRRNEIGVRIALGATRGHVLRLVLREALLLLGVGLAVGLLLSLWAGQAAATLLFGLKPNDLISLAAASLMLAVVALVATYIPARRAAVLDPVATLRNE